ncbi:MAG: hypothetical protein IJ150_13480 [Bacteroidales bacterium]|nr:hypothetical protein [Bacteroidales bacterium]
MKRIFLTFFCGALVMLTAPSCSKDEGTILQAPVEQTTSDTPLADEKSNAPIEQVISDTSSVDVNNAPIAKVWHVTLKAKTASNGISKALKAVNNSDNTFGYTLKGEFSKGEVVYVLKNEEKVGTLTAKHTGEWITFDGTFTTVTDLHKDDELELRSPNEVLSYDGQTGTIESACNHYYAKATVKVTAIEGSNVTVEDAVFEFCSSMVKFNLNNDVTTFTISDGTNNITVTPASATKEIYVSLPPKDESTSYTISVTSGTDNLNVTKTYNIATNKYYTATVDF